jgi:hypothetical protein
VTAVLEQLAPADGAWSVEEALATMRTFYNGYRFSEEASESLYNPTLSLYFLDALRTTGSVSAPHAGRESGDGSQQADLYRAVARG